MCLRLAAKPRNRSRAGWRRCRQRALRAAGRHPRDRSPGKSARRAAAPRARKATRRQPADLGVEQCGIVSFLKHGEPPGQTRDGLSAMNINVHVSRPTRAPALDLPARGLDALVRANVHYCNDESEVERFVRAVADEDCLKA